MCSRRLVIYGTDTDIIERLAESVSSEAFLGTHAEEKKMYVLVELGRISKCSVVDL